MRFFGDFLRKFVVATGWNQLQVVSQEDLVFPFASVVTPGVAKYDRSRKD
jgi:hypothetical protein